MLLRWMGTSQVRFLFLGCERLDEESPLTGEWNTPSQLTGDDQVCATVSPPNCSNHAPLTCTASKRAHATLGRLSVPYLAFATERLSCVASGLTVPRSLRPLGGALLSPLGS